MDLKIQGDFHQNTSGFVCLSVLELDELLLKFVRRSKSPQNQDSEEEGAAGSVGGGCSRHKETHREAAAAGLGRSRAGVRTWHMQSSVGPDVEVRKQTLGLGSLWSQKTYFRWVKKLKYKKQVFKTLRRKYREYL